MAYLLDTNACVEFFRGRNAYSFSGSMLARRPTSASAQ